VKKWQWSLLAVFTYVIFVVMYTPAQYVADYVQRSTQNKAVFEGVAGTVFSGSAKTVSYEGLQVSDVDWTLSAFSLLLLQADLDVQGGAIRSADKLYIDGNFSLSLLDPETVTIKNARLFSPAKPLLAQVDLPVAVTALGRFSLDIEFLKFSQGCQELSGKGRWLMAALNIEGQPLDLGSFNAALSCEAPSFVMQISPDNGISLDSKISFDQNGNYSATGTYTIPSDFPTEVKQGASFFGTSLGQGRYKLNMKSRNAPK
jgi:general secretion pathway protein N